MHLHTQRVNTLRVAYNWNYHSFYCVIVSSILFVRVVKVLAIQSFVVTNGLGWVRAEYTFSSIFHAKSIHWKRYITLKYFVSLQTFCQLLLLLLLFHILLPLKVETAIPLTSLEFDNSFSFIWESSMISLSLPFNRLNLMNDSPELLIFCQRLKLQEIAIMQAIYFFWIAACVCINFLEEQYCQWSEMQSNLIDKRFSVILSANNSFVSSCRLKGTKEITMNLFGLYQSMGKLKSDSFNEFRLLLFIYFYWRKMHWNPKRCKI